MAWFDRPEPATRTRLVRDLQSVLPRPETSDGAFSRDLEPDVPAEALAAGLRSRPGFLWLDGGKGDHMLMAEPVARIVVRDGVARARGPRGGIALHASGLDLLEAALEAWGPDENAILAGYLGYELGRDLERLPSPPPDDGDLPDLWLALYDRVVRGRRGGWSVSGTTDFRGGEPFDDLPGPSLPGEPRDGCMARGPLTSRPGAADYRDAVARTIRRIHDGEVFQVNLCRRLEAAFDPADTWSLYRNLRRRTPADYAAFIDMGDGRAVLSASPERFVTVRDGRVESRPIKGTRPRGETPEEDEALAEELETSEKDRAELAMIVDLVRNDLGRVCRTGSVEVASHAELSSLPTVHHTHSVVTGRLRDDASSADLLRATFPAGSITGAPKIQAMVIASQEEERRRGPAMGAIGWIGLDGSLDLSVAIRTAVVARGRVTYHAGCGIVAGSDPERELQETCAKARAFLDALGTVEDDA
jgi:para-aminobenzoate synthetase component 1